MNWLSSIGSWTSQAWSSLTGIGGKIGQAGSFLWRQARQAALGVQYIFTHPVNDIMNAAALLSAMLTGNMTAANNAYSRLVGYTNRTQVKPFSTWAKAQLRKLWAALASLRAWVLRQIHYLEWALKRWTWRLVATERRYRIQGDRHGLAYTRQRVKWALGIVQKEAASGYRRSLRGRRGVLAVLADDIITRDPVLNDIVTKIVEGAIGLAEVEDPLLRFTLGILVKQVISHLGADKPMGTLLGDLLAPVFGEPPPSNLNDVIWQIGERLNAVEGQWATFFGDGGSQVEQAGSEWANITSLATDAALAAFFGVMVADPQAWARDISAVAGPVVHGAVTGINDAMTVWR